VGSWRKMLQPPDGLKQSLSGFRGHKRIKHKD
jgi:hypothetical protein